MSARQHINRAHVIAIRLTTLPGFLAILLNVLVLLVVGFPFNLLVVLVLGIPCYLLVA